MNEYHENANEYEGMNKGNELLRVWMHELLRVRMHELLRVQMQMNDGNVLLRMQSYE